MQAVDKAIEDLENIVGPVDYEIPESMFAKPKQPYKRRAGYTTNKGNGQGKDKRKAAKVSRRKNR